MYLSKIYLYFYISEVVNVWSALLKILLLDKDSFVAGSSRKTSLQVLAALLMLRNESW